MRIKEIPEDIGSYFQYDAETGVITRRLNQGNYRAGTPCMSVVSRGDYYKLHHAGKDYLQHRVAWFLHYGTQPPATLDHVDLNGMNNRIANLREATNGTNQMNITATSKSTTGIKGIFPVRGGKLYRAEVCIEGKRYQKHAAKPEKLLVWVEEMRNKLHGEYARHA